MHTAESQWTGIRPPTAAVSGMPSSAGNAPQAAMIIVSATAWWAMPTLQILPSRCIESPFQGYIPPK